MAQLDRLRALAGSLANVAAADYVSPVPAAVVALLATLVDGITLSLAELGEDPDFAGLDDVVAASQIRTFNHAMALVGRIANLVQSSSGGGSLAAWELPLIRYLDSSSLSLMLFPSDLLSYRTADLLDVVDRLTADIGLGLPAELLARPIYLVGSPGPQVKTSLEHVLLFHEVGHIHLYRDLDLRSVCTRAELSDAALRALPGLGGLSDYDANRWRLRYSSWLSEVTCDLVGFYFGGPAFIAAACEVFATLGADSDGSDSHPASLARLTILFRALDAAGGATGRLADYLADWRVTVDHRTSAEVADPLSSQLLATAPEVIERVSEWIPAHKRYSLDEDLAALIQRMNIGVPPDAWGFGVGARPSTLAEALNAGWEWYCAVELPARTDELRARREHSERLTAKAVELSETARRWAEVTS